MPRARTVVILDLCSACLSVCLSAGGVIRTVVIDAEGVTRDFLAGDQLPFMMAQNAAK